jgi:hypothetical protein
MCIGIYHIACAQASLFYKTNKYFHININDAGYHELLSHSLAHACASFAQPQSKCMLLFVCLFVCEAPR